MLIGQKPQKLHCRDLFFVVIATIYIIIPLVQLKKEDVFIIINVVLKDTVIQYVKDIIFRHCY